MPSAWLTSSNTDCFNALNTCPQCMSQILDGPLLRLTCFPLCFYKDTLQDLYLQFLEEDCISSWWDVWFGWLPKLLLGSVAIHRTNLKQTIWKEIFEKNNYFWGIKIFYQKSKSSQGRILTQRDWPRRAQSKKLAAWCENTTQLMLPVIRLNSLGSPVC